MPYRAISLTTLSNLLSQMIVSEPYEYNGDTFYRYIYYLNKLLSYNYFKLRDVTDLYKLTKKVSTSIMLLNYFDKNIKCICGTIEQKFDYHDGLWYVYDSGSLFVRNIFTRY